MASLDYCYDILEKLNEEKMDYVLIVIQRGDEVFKANVFDNIGVNDVGKKVMAKALTEARKQLLARKNDKNGNQDIPE